MNWYELALIGAVLVSAATIIEKKTLFKEHAMEFATILALFNGLLSIPLFWHADFSQLNPWILGLIFAGSVIGTISLFLITKITRHMPISESSPLLVMSPVFAAIFALSFLGETMTMIQIAGLVVLVIGAYVLETHRSKRLFEPLRNFFSSKYAKILIISLVLYGFGAVLDRVILAHYHVQARVYLGVVQIFMAINFLVLISIFHDGWRGIKHGIKNTGWLILVVAILTVLHRMFYVESVATANVGLVAGIKRSSVLFTTFIGGELFHEKNLLRKIIACSIMVVGIYLLIN